MPAFTKILLTGAHGQLANALKRSAPSACEIIALGHGDLDICNEQNVSNVIQHYRPHCVINGAAYNLVDKAETDRTTAFQINATGAFNLARHCKENDIPLVHFSTDFVFDGQKKSPYLEDDVTNPLSVYAASKLAGENAVLLSSENNWVIRVSRLFGPIELKPGSAGQKPAGNFPLAMLQLAAKHSQLRIVNDQIGSPSYTPDLAQRVWQLLEKSNGGLFHLTNSGEVAFDEYARTIFKIAGINCTVQGISSAEYSAPAKRPPYSPLSNAKIQRLGISPLRPWQEALEDYLKSDMVQNLLKNAVNHTNL